ncbi:prepilin-type N-terminal cleavage/methylation domain-containing protein [Enterococcus sp. BWT-B8]|uniref:type IV pilus modification PilV family protein n=1 Tax=Enterococcus sp. BWT-B8 TaxID=2885157 RepID=UPI001E41D5EB|nr:type II secretion system protein [Enterococcus sp. BWT-B8]MCB5952537.1 prepilin-type N-terminal cleavage/methylation domain-containing protein [Enterococcus sp. BWT-B8]
MKKNKEGRVKTAVTEIIKNRQLDERGFSLLEILIAIVLLGTSFLFLASMIYQNNQAIKLNKRKEEAIFVREDIKEWLLYKSQLQDIANLNSFVFIEFKASLDEGQIARRNHLILDNSGIQRDVLTGKGKYGEIEVPLSDDERGTFIQKLKYHLTDADFLPESLRTDGNQLYIGQYVDRFNEETDFLVKIVVNHKVGVSEYNPRTDGVSLNILIYDKQNGSLLTETYVNWVVES